MQIEVEMILALAQAMNIQGGRIAKLEEQVAYLTNASNRHEAIIGEIVEDIDDMNDEIEELGECHNNLADVVLPDCECDEDEEKCTCGCHCNCNE